MVDVYIYRHVEAMHRFRQMKYSNRPSIEHIEFFVAVRMVLRLIISLQKSCRKKSISGD